MKLHEIQRTLEDLTKEYYAIGRTLNFDEWLTAQCIQLRNEAQQWEYAHAKLEEKLRTQYDAEFEAFKTSLINRTVTRVDQLEEWLTEYRDQLKKGNVFHKNQGIINAINEILNENT